MLAMRCRHSAAAAASEGAWSESACSSGRQMLVAPLVAQWSNDYAVDRSHHVRDIAQWRDRPDHRPYRRLRSWLTPVTPTSPREAENASGGLWAGGTLVSWRQGAGAPGSQARRPGSRNPLGNQWNDPTIAALNPGASLPATKITPVYRSDSSGDTYAFSDFLAKSSPEWKSQKGFSTQVDFATGVGAKGNDGVAAAISRTDGSLGYLAISYVLSNKLAYALIRNRAGNYPVPGPDTITAAANSVTTIPSDNAISITDPPASAANGYPISTFTYVLFPTTSSKAKTLHDFITYAIGPGQEFGAKLQFAPLPAEVVSAAKQTLAKLG
jgi:phosphate transport system substrate-binding protein